MKPTLQIVDHRYQNVFAVGDIAESGAAKAARPGSVQAALVADNIKRMIQDRPGGPKLDLQLYRSDPAGIHLSLGLVSRLIRSRVDSN